MLFDYLLSGLVKGDGYGLLPFLMNSRLLKCMVVPDVDVRD